jgi:16S rRNA (guanine(966)-N(2))-methyltransferase RsmD
MRVISGFYKGKKISGNGDLSIRPTTDRVKEYIFNVLQDFVINKNCLDIFAGSGNLGIECLSRGAKYVTWVEKAQTSINVLQSNLNNIKIDKSKYSIVHQDALEFAKTDKTQGYDLILLDPPYEYPPLQYFLNQLFNGGLTQSDSLAVVEHDVTNPIESEHNRYEIIKQKKMGRSLISFLIKRV